MSCPALNLVLRFGRFISLYFFRMSKILSLPNAFEQSPMNCSSLTFLKTATFLIN